MLPVKKITSVLFIAILASITVAVSVGSAAAQEKRSLFDKLFGRKKPAEEVKKSSSKNRRTKASARNKGKNQATPNRNQAAMPRAKPAIEKSENAKRILIVGDFIAGHLADGLVALYANNPDIIVVKQIEAASGLVRDDYYHWPIQIGEGIAEHKPDMMIVALGANDRQTLRIGEQAIDYGSDGWFVHYRNRVGNLADKLTQDEKTPVWAWLGLPPFQKTLLNDAALVFNSIYEEEATKRQGRFIDIWRGFIDDKENFNFSGYDVNGQIARLRNADGINFTPAGRAKLAFYADEVVQALLQQEVIAVPEEVLLLDAEHKNLTPEIKTEAEGAPLVRQITYLPPRKLSEISETETELIRSDDSAPFLAVPFRHEAPPPGRADHFFVE